MANIIAGRFDTVEDAEPALAELRSAFGAKEVQTFYVGPPGQRAHFPIGGDKYADPGTEDAGAGAAAGAAAGGAAGVVLGAAAAAATPVLGPLAIVGAAAIGAYTGSLHGALAESGDEKTPKERKSGLMVAVHADAPEQSSRAIDLLKQHGAQDIERAEGTWNDGDWADFDSLRNPQLVNVSER